MGHAIPRQHPAVVLRSHFNLVRALLAVATLAIVGLTVAVVILANENDAGGTTAVQPLEAGRHLNGAPPTVQSDPLADRGRPGAAATRYDGGPEEGTRGLIASPSAPSTRYDGGPEEGTRGQVASPSAPSTRYDGGPEEGTRGQVGSQSPVASRYDGGPEEGSRGPGR